MKLNLNAKPMNTCVQCHKSVAIDLIDFCSETCAANFENWINSDLCPEANELSFWMHYRILQQEFLRTLDYIAPHPNNLQTFSNRLLSLIRETGAEIDSACKKLIGLPNASDSNMRGWRIHLEKTYGISRVCLPVPIFNDYVRPFRAFEIGSSPAWWKAYTDLKHKREAVFPQASLGNAREALGALLILNVILLEPVFSKIIEYGERTPKYSDAGIVNEIESLFRLAGPGIESTHSGTLRVFRIQPQPDPEAIVK